MVARTVNFAVAAYVDSANIHRYGWLGEQVDVHPDHVERFDDLNGAPADSKIVAEHGPELKRSQGAKPVRRQSSK